ncbi:MAG: lyase family protein, partial [Paracoccaceae bacterium]
MAELLGFSGIKQNSYGCIASVDYVTGFYSALRLVFLHLGRVVQDMAFWSAFEVGQLYVPNALVQVSSIMPQKRNPDAAELLRAKIGRIFGAQSTLTMVMKGLPLSYSKDMQEDKEVTFDAADSVMLAVNAMCGMVKDLSANKPRLEQATNQGHITATDLADWLVRELDLPFRDSHH